MEKQSGFIKDAKLRGEWAELRFMARAAEHGLSVSKPFGDSQRYDVTVENKGRFLRVQVKSTMSCRGKGYICTLGKSRLPHYTTGDLDFFAIYVIPAEAWYIIPAEVGIRHTSNILLSPGQKGSKYGPYMEAWWLLRGEMAEPRAQTDAG